MSSSLNYSVYQSSESGGTKKRVATLGKPVSDSIMTSATTTTIEEDDKSKSGEKKTKTASEKKSKPPQMGGNMMREREREAFTPQDKYSDFSVPDPTILPDDEMKQDRAARMNQLIMEHTAPDNDERLGNFTPLEPPKLSRLPLQDDSSYSGATNGGSTKGNTDTDFVSPVYTDDTTNQYSNYRYIYDTAPTIPAFSGGYAQRRQGAASAKNMAPGFMSPGLDPGSRRDMDKIWERLNYMTMLLEEQHNERTRFVTEEFFLYTFLGIFMIYIVDGFSRSGKYVR
jgi:hypothetical protein